MNMKVAGVFPNGRTSAHSFVSTMELPQKKKSLSALLSVFFVSHGIEVTPNVSFTFLGQQATAQPFVSHLRCATETLRFVFLTKITNLRGRSEKTQLARSCEVNIYAGWHVMLLHAPYKWLPIVIINDLNLPRVRGMCWFYGTEPFLYGTICLHPLVYWYEVGRHILLWWHFLF